MAEDALKRAYLMTGPWELDPTGKHPGIYIDDPEGGDPICLCTLARIYRPELLGDALRASDATRGREAWRPISEAKKDGTVIWALFRSDIYPGLRPTRDDLESWNGVQVPLRHPGVYEHDGREWDHGWGIAAPVGQGGLPDEWIAGWMPLPAPLLPTDASGGAAC